KVFIQYFSGRGNPPLQSITKKIHMNIVLKMSTAPGMATTHLKHHDWPDPSLTCEKYACFYHFCP
ncbi:MAG: hypothetical protein IJA70_01695, partial [Oscillospiraceae bacterium]|nr:hypothetical protein [Oscillospiraceae bacterium]